MLSLFDSHLTNMLQRTRRILEQFEFDSLLVYSGHTENHFLDDYAPAFKANPHFVQWMPFLTDHPKSWVLITNEGKPKLFIYSPDDFWHVTPSQPDAFWCEHYDITLFADANVLLNQLPSMGRTALVSGNHLDALPPNVSVNAADLLAAIHHDRATKSEFEQGCIREANRVAALGHQAAQLGFSQGLSEFEIHQMYLGATQQLETALPYNNIIGLNEHAAVLHYQHKETVLPGNHRSMLVDAGATHWGYVADITRTTSQGDQAFAALIEELDRAQLEIVASAKVGTSFVALHEQMHAKLFDILLLSGVITTELQNDAERLALTRTFFPHGLGHLLGIQVHDIGGWQHDASGAIVEPPEAHPFLRLTRTLEEGMVVTIEPGLYFIPSLLAQLKDTALHQHVNWSLVEHLLPWGGIRIEDNVCVKANGAENYTRDAFAASALR